MRHMIETYWKDLHLRAATSCCILHTPPSKSCGKTSGHSDFYSENMYQPIKVEEEMYQLKPMNCPFHIVVYQDGYSCKDLLIRWAELGTVYRYERSGTMHGLFRVRGLHARRRAHLLLARSNHLGDQGRFGFDQGNPLDVASRISRSTSPPDRKSLLVTTAFGTRRRARSRMR